MGDFIQDADSDPGPKHEDANGTEDEVLLLGVAPWWNFTTVTAAFTLGVIYTPFSWSGAGWTWGTLFFVYSFATTWYTGRILGKLSIPEGERSSYPHLGKKYTGRAGEIFVYVAQFLAYYTVGVALLVNLGQWQSMLMRHYAGRLCLTELIAYSAVFSAVLASMTTTFRHVMPWAVLSLLSTLVRTILLVVQIVRYDMFATCSPTFGASVTGVSTMEALATSAFLFGGHGLFPEEIREMRKDHREHRFNLALALAYVVIGVTYLIWGPLSYAVWGDSVTGDIVQLWPDDDVTSAALVFSVIWGIVELQVSQVLLMLTVEIHGIGLHPHESWFAPRTAWWWSGRMPPALLRVLVRCGIVLTQLFWALMLQDAGIANIQALCGAIGFSALTYFFPFVLYDRFRKGSKPHPAWRSLWFLLFLSGFVVLIGGVVSSIEGFVTTTNGALFGAGGCGVVDLVGNTTCRYSNPKF